MQYKSKGGYFVQGREKDQGKVRRVRGKYLRVQGPLRDEEIFSPKGQVQQE